MKRQQLHPKLHAYCEKMEQEFSLIPAHRIAKLNQLADYVKSKLVVSETPQITVICTHNSRRSHIGQLWIAIGATYYGLPEIQTFSGGTEATAFNHRAVRAFQNIGLDIQTAMPTATNPIYQIKWTADSKPYLAFSKKYDLPPNPTQNFAAILVCNSADKGCPIVQGCDFRLFLPYDDPKAFDDTEKEGSKYAQKLREIGREMFFMLYQVQQK